MTTSTLPLLPTQRPAPTTCLYCQSVITGRSVRGCCSGRCAYLEHDNDDHDYDPED